MAMKGELLNRLKDIDSFPFDQHFTEAGSDCLPNIQIQRN